MVTVRECNETCNIGYDNGNMSNNLKSKRVIHLTDNLC